MHVVKAYVPNRTLRKTEALMAELLAFTRPQRRSLPDSLNSEANSTSCPRRSFGDKCQELALKNPSAMRVLEDVIDDLLVRVAVRANSSLCVALAAMSTGFGPM